MKAVERIAAAGTSDDLMQRIRAFLSGEGYVETNVAVAAAAFVRPGRRLASRIEKLPRRLEVELSGGPDVDPTTPRGIWLRYACPTPLRLPTRIDATFFRLEAESLDHFLRRGTRIDAAARLDVLRKPIGFVVAANVLTGSVIVASAGRLAGFPLGVILATTIAVALLNVIAIVGFADVVVGAMDELRDDDR